MSGAATTAEVEAAFDRDLERLLDRVDSLAQAPDSGGMSFSVDGSDDDQTAATEFEAFLQRLGEDLLQFAVLRTGPQQQPEVGTWMAWSGDTRVVLRPGTSAAALAEHRDALQQQLRRRRMRLRLLTTTVAAAARIAALATTPGGALLALPTAWRYVRSMTAQWNSQLNT